MTDHKINFAENGGMENEMDEKDIINEETEPAEAVNASDTVDTADVKNASNASNASDVKNTSDTSDVKNASDSKDAAVDEAPPENSEGSEKKGGGHAGRSDARRMKAEIAALTKQLEEKDGAIAAADDKYLRLAAEYDNFRRRSREERESAYFSAVSDTIKELLPLFDNLELASKYTGADGAGETSKGVEMILSSVPGILEKLGVTVFGEPGDSFNPEIHNAVMHVEDDSLGEGVVTDVFQKGYMHGERVIRFAMVKVAN